MNRPTTPASPTTRMTEEDIKAARTDGAGLSACEHGLAHAAAELVRDHCISETTSAALGERYSQVQKMEVVGLLDTYTTLAMIMRSYRIALEAPRSSTA